MTKRKRKCGCGAPIFGPLCVNGHTDSWRQNLADHIAKNKEKSK